MGKKNGQVGARIAALRRERGLTQEQLAEKLHVTRQTVSSWETANSYPDVEMLAALSEVLEVSVEQLIYGEAREKAGEDLPRWMKMFLYVLMLMLAWLFLEEQYSGGTVLIGVLLILAATIFYGILVIAEELRRLR